MKVERIEVERKKKKEGERGGRKVNCKEEVKRDTEEFEDNVKRNTEEGWKAKIKEK